MAKMSTMHCPKIWYHFFLSVWIRPIIRARLREKFDFASAIVAIASGSYISRQDCLCCSRRTDLRIVRRRCVFSCCPDSDKYFSRPRKALVSSTWSSAYWDIVITDFTVCSTNADWYLKNFMSLCEYHKSDLCSEEMFLMDFTWISSVKETLLIHWEEEFSWGKSTMGAIIILVLARRS